MNNKTYMMIGGVVLVLLFGYFLIKGQSYPAVEAPQKVVPTQEVVQQPSPTSVVPTVATTSAEVASKATVEHKDDAFVPKSITVKVGTAVTWINQEDDPMWVASVVHPTHQVLPGFDQLSSVSKGGSYSYTFTQKGSWKYHNHLQPSHTGIVIVE